MQRSGSSKVREIEAAHVKTAVEKKAATLTSEEEKVLRMRHGSKVDPRKPLEQRGQGNPDLQDELLLIEMQLLRAWKEHKARLARQAAPAVQPSRTKDKIVRALRKKH